MTINQTFKPDRLAGSSRLQVQPTSVMCGAGAGLIISRVPEETKEQTVGGHSTSHRAKT